MSFLKSPLQMSVDDFEKNRDDMVERFNDEVEKLGNAENDFGLADEVEYDCLSLDFLSKLENLDAVTFIQVDVAEKDNTVQLFGEISKAVSDAIETEINDMANVNNNNAAAQATPEVLRDNYLVKRKRIIEEVIYNTNSEEADNNIMTVRCMDIYSEMAQTTEAISERTAKKMKEHERILLFIGVSPKPNPELSEAQLSEVVSYTIAVVSNIKDGTIPDIDKYKDKVVELINNSTNAVIASSDVSATLRSFEDVAETLASCKEHLNDNPNAKNFINTISAIENICQNQKEQINTLYEDMTK